MTDWLGDTPVFLLLLNDGETTVIDVDQHGWHGIHADLMRRPGTWYLVSKTNNSVIGGVLVGEGEKPYYVARHVGIGSARPGADGVIPVTELIAYGIGKHRRDGHDDRLWFFGNGFVCAGDDVERFAIDMIKRGQT